MTLYNPQDDNPIIEGDRTQAHPSNVARARLSGDTTPGKDSGWSWKTIFEYLASNLWTSVQAPVITWHRGWTAGLYPQGAMVQDGGFLMIANKTTADKAAPIPSGSPAFSAPDAPAWGGQSPSALLIASGHRYTFSAAVLAVGMRVWIPVTSVNHSYHMVLREVVGGGVPDLYHVDEDINPLATGWYEINLAGLVAHIGEVWEVFLFTSAGVDYTQWAGVWELKYEGGNPSDGEIYLDAPGANEVRISSEDKEGTNMAGLLDTVVTGTIITFGNGSVKTVINIIDNTGGTRIYQVRGSSGVPLDEEQVVSFAVPNAANTDYVGVGDHWTANQPAFATVVSLFQEDGGTIIEDVDLFGADISVQDVVASPDWDIAAISNL